MLRPARDATNIAPQKVGMATTASVHGKWKVYLIEKKNNKNDIVVIMFQNLHSNLTEIVIMNRK